MRELQRWQNLWAQHRGVLRGKASSTFCTNANKRHQDNQRSQSGQMTIELAVCFPVLLAVGLIVVNALLFFSECAAFDRAFKNAACAYAASPAYAQTLEQSCAKIQHSIEGVCNTNYVDVSVLSKGIDGGVVTFEGTLHFTPTLFGAGTLKSAFGVSFPQLTHQNKLALQSYQPGSVL